MQHYLSPSLVYAYSINTRENDLHTGNNKVVGKDYGER